jgi:flagellar hook assembly protein FlgD
MPSIGDVHDVAGRLVTRLVDGVEDAGTHRIEWNGTDARGRPLASGVYLCRLTTDGTTITRKLVLLK